PDGAGAAAGGLQQHDRARRGALHRAHLRVRGRRHDPAARDRRRAHPDDAATRRLQGPGRREAGGRAGAGPDSGRARRSGEGRSRSMMPITVSHYLVLAAVLFSIAVAGIFINRRNVILLLMCVELILLSVNFNFVAFSRMLGDSLGQVFVFFILTVAAAEAAIGLAILVVLFRNGKSVNVDDLSRMKG